MKLSLTDSNTKDYAGKAKFRGKNYQVKMQKRQGNDVYNLEFTLTPKKGSTALVVRGVEHEGSFSGMLNISESTEEFVFLTFSTDVSMDMVDKKEIGIAI